MEKIIPPNDLNDTLPTWRLLDTPPMTAAENMALDEALLEVKGEGKSPNTIRFLQFSPRAVLVGFHQALHEEIRRDYCQANRIDINRRITGGGAIFFDENQLGWEVFCDKAFFNAAIPNARLFKTLCEPVVAALARLNLEAEFRPRNDIEIDGRKISGTGGTESGRAFMFQGTMLVDFDVDTMLRALKIPVEKLKAKEIDSVKDRVTCLKWELGEAPALADIKQAIKRGFTKGLNIRLDSGGLNAEEQKRFAKNDPVFGPSDGSTASSPGSRNARPCGRPTKPRPAWCALPWRLTCPRNGSRMCISPVIFSPFPAGRFMSWKQGSGAPRLTASTCMG